MDREAYEPENVTPELKLIADRLQQLRLGMRSDIAAMGKETHARRTDIEETLDIIARELARWASDRNGS